MTPILGLLMVLVLVFGGYVLSGGNFDIILKALPYEGMIVGGAAIGAFVIGNSVATLRKTLGGIARVLAGPRWDEGDYADLLKLLYEFCRLRRTNYLLVENHIENPDESDILASYPRLRDDPDAMALIRDSFRLVSMQFENPAETQVVLDRRLAKRKKEALAPVKALDVMADALPAIGIVAAVLGVIKTMAVVDQSPQVLGEMIAGALVGTFLGVFLSYCVVSPVAGRLRQIEEQDAQLYQVIRDILVAMVSGHPPNICVEIGRNGIPSALQPEFEEVEAITRDLSLAS